MVHHKRRERKLPVQQLSILGKSLPTRSHLVGDVLSLCCTCGRKGSHGVEDSTSSTVSAFVTRTEDRDRATADQPQLTGLLHSNMSIRRTPRLYVALSLPS